MSERIDRRLFIAGIVVASLAPAAVMSLTKPAPPSIDASWPIDCRPGKANGPYLETKVFKKGHQLRYAVAADPSSRSALVHVFQPSEVERLTGKKYELVHDVEIRRL